MLLLRRLARLSILTVVLMLGACGGLSNEPQIVATLAPPTAQATTQPDYGFPLIPPDLANGANLFAAHCASCHGLDGSGNGEMVTSGRLAVDGEVIHPPSFLDPATQRDQTPQEWFLTITNGRIERLMPPWAQALTEQERWDVGFYTYTLHYTQEQLARGHELYEIECVDCHGLEGRGDGPDAAEVRKQVEDLTNQYDLATTSDKVLFNFINEGSADAMPAFGEDYTEDQIWDAVAYARILTLTNTDVIGQQAAAQPEATAESTADINQPSVTLAAESTGTISGTITNGTEGGEVPTDLTVTLFVVDAEFNTQRFETTVDAAGNFTFADMPLGANLSYATTVNYRERPFASQVITGGTPDMQLPITIYELTEDPSVITITGLVYQISAVADGLQVAQVMIFQNDSDRLFTSGRTVGENEYASVFVTLPPGASVLGFPDGQGRFIVSDDQSTIIDTVGVVPGRDHIVQVIYLVPYEGSAIIEQPVNYALSGPVRLLLRPETVIATSEQLPAIGPQDVGGATYGGYGTELTLAAGQVIRFELNGSGVTSAAQLEPPGVPSNTLIIIVVLAVVGIAVLIGVVYRLNRRPAATSDKASKQQLMDALLRQIAELDEAETRGEINHDLYHHQRKQLKARLAELMEESD